MRDRPFPRGWGLLSRGGLALARLARLASVGQLAGYQLDSSADLPTNVSGIADGTYRFVFWRVLSVGKLYTFEL